jgi:hypothetical protein
VLAASQKRGHRQQRQASESIHFISKVVGSDRK